MKHHAARSDSAFLQIKIRVPSDVVERARGRLITVTLPGSAGEAEEVVTFKLGEFCKGSLRTRDARTADLRRHAVIGALAGLCDAIRRGPAVLSQRQIAALSGEVYRLLMAEHGDNPGTEAEWARFKALTRAAMEGRIPGAPAIPERGRSDDAVMTELLFGAEGDLTDRVNALPITDDMRALEQRVGRLAYWTLARHGIEIEDAQRLALLREIARAALDAGWALKRAAGGDYAADPKASRFPQYEDKPKATGLTLSGLFEQWRAETKPAAGTVSSWSSVLRSLTAHLGRDEVVSRITKANLLAWKDDEVARGKHGRTVNLHLMALRALLNFAKRNGIVRENVAEGVRVLVRTKAGEKMLPYTDDDVARLLKHAAGQDHPARKWLPLLAVLTGARIGELAQAWGNQIVQREGVWVLEIRPAPDGGSLKNSASERTVPLHPHILAAGFLEYALSKQDGPLFYGKPARPGAKGVHPSKGTTNKLGEWIRSLPGFDDERRAPAHAARHWFKTKGAELEIMDSVVNAIQGHADATVAGRYRHISLEQMARAVERFPVPTLVRDDGVRHAKIRAEAL